VQFTNSAGKEDDDRQKEADKLAGVAIYRNALGLAGVAIYRKALGLTEDRCGFGGAGGWCTLAKLMPL
jgi:hypothetical protein